MGSNSIAENSPIKEEDGAVSTRIQTAKLTALFFSVCYAAGVFALLLSANFYTTPTKAAASAGVSIMVAFASSVAGGLVGFLFGIPRSNTKAGVPQSDLVSQKNSPNTNLEDVSDWLTKVIVGVGLTQAHEILKYAKDTVKFVAQGLSLNTSPESAQVLAGSAMLYFAVLSFLYIWMSTRLYLNAAMSSWDKVAEAVQNVVRKEVRGQLPELSNQISTQISTQVSEEVDKKITEDRKIENMVIAYLEPGSDLTPLAAKAEAAILNAIETAPDSTKGRIFYRARTIRYGIYKAKQVEEEVVRKLSNESKASAAEPFQTILNDLDRCKLERVVHVLDSLVSSDKENKYHRNHGQLGYAYKLLGNWSKAIDEFSKAIEIRTAVDPQSSSYFLYEFNRAESRVLASKGAPSDEQRFLILEDLGIAKQAPHLREKIVKEYPQFAKELALV